MLGGVGLVSGLTGKLGRAWVVHSIGAWRVHRCMVVLCGGGLNAFVHKSPIVVQ